jgi:hypothetical protein
MLGGFFFRVLQGLGFKSFFIPNAILLVDLGRVFKIIFVEFQSAGLNSSYQLIFKGDF